MKRDGFAFYQESKPVFVLTFFLLFAICNMHLAHMNNKVVMQAKRPLE